MNSKTLSPLVPLGLSSLIVGSLLCGGACSDPADTPATGGEEPRTSQGQGEGPSTDQGEVVLPEATQKVIEEMFGKPATAPEKGPTYPDLGFEAQLEGLPLGGTWREHPILADFDGDGRDDLVASNREEDGLNTWRAPGPGETAWQLRIEGLPRDMMYGGCDAADLDGDGDLDLVYVAHSDGLRVFLNDGKMAWEEPATFYNPFLMLDVALGDVNGDGNHDAVGIGHFNGGMGVYLGDGKGGFERLEQSKDVLPSSVFGTQVELADIDQDGLDDILTCTNKGAKVFYTRHKEEESDELSWVEGSEGLPVPVIGNALRGLVPGDFTGDGKLELAFCSLADPGVPVAERDDCGVLALQDDGSWKRIDQGLPRGPAFRDVAAADFDKDGKLDLMLLTNQGGAVMYQGDGKAGFAPIGALEDTVRGGSLGVGDADGNGWLDVVVRSADTKANPTGGGLIVHLNSADVWKNR